MQFQDLGLVEPVLKAVLAEGYTTPTPIQESAIPHIMAGRDLIGTAQTGTGKTAAFALPILHRLITIPDNQNGYYKPRVLVLSPTRELATQIADSFQTYGAGSGMRQVVVYGGVSQVPQVKLLRRGVDIIIATPGRLLDLSNQGCLQLDSIEMFVLDEADRMLDMGFMPDIRRIIDLLPGQRQTLLFSATMPPAIERLASELLTDPAEVRIAPRAATTDLVTQHLFHVERGNKPAALAAYLTSQSVERAVVFTRTKQSAERVATRLCRAGVSADAIHGNKTQNARQRTLNAFRANRVTVLVATDVAARGLDVDGVSHVVNYDLPMEAETYVHRIGRTGRAGANGIAMSFVDREQRPLLHAIERLLRKKIPVQSIEYSDQSSALALPGSPPSPVEQPQKPRTSPPPHHDRPKGEAGEGEYRPRERREGDRPDRRRERGPQGGGERREFRRRDGQGAERSSGNREGRPPRRDQGDRPAYGKRFRTGEGGEGQRSGGDRPRYGDRPQGKRYGDRPAFVRRERTEPVAGDAAPGGDAPAGSSEQRFERRPRYEQRPGGERRGRPQGGRPAYGEGRRRDGEGRPAYGEGRRRDGEGRPAYGEGRRRDGEGRPASGERQFGGKKKFPPKRFEGDRKSFGPGKRPRTNDAAETLPPPRRESADSSNGSDATAQRPRRKAPIMKKRRHREGGGSGGPSQGSAAPRRYEGGSAE